MSTFSSSVPTYLYATLLSGQYDIPAIYCEVDAVYTNTVPVDAYRGAGRPEATFVVERLVEVGARELGIDPADLRKQNFIKSFPHQTPVIMAYDAGDYHASLKKAMEIADVKGFGKRKRDSGAHRQAARHRLFDLHRGLRHRAVAGGRLARRGRGPMGIRRGAGQPDRLGRSADRLPQPRPGPRNHLRATRLRAARHPDRQRQRSSTATPTRCSSAWAPTARAPARSACRRSSRRSTRSRPRPRRSRPSCWRPPKATSSSRTASSPSPAPTSRRPGARSTLNAYIAHKFTGAQLEPGLKEGAFYDPTNFTFPAGCHICEVEIDPDTGHTEIVGWTAVDDFGIVINPMIVEGQVHGGVAQGVGQALFEGAVYDKERPARVRLVHGLRHAARRQSAVAQGRHHRDEMPVQSARHQGLRRGGRDRGAGGGDQRHHRRDRHAKIWPCRRRPRRSGRRSARPRRCSKQQNEEETTSMYEFKFHRPTTVRQAANLLAKNSEAKILAGGHSLHPGDEAAARQADRPRRPRPRSKACPASSCKGRSIVIGAMTRHVDVANSQVVKEALPVLAEVAGLIGDPAVRHRGTIGGSLANNDPNADYPAAVLGLGATIITNKRRIAADDFFKGMFETALEPDEIITKVSFPIAKKAAYEKFKHPASGFALVGVFVSQARLRHPRRGDRRGLERRVPRQELRGGAEEALLAEVDRGHDHPGRRHERRHPRQRRIPRASGRRAGAPGAGAGVAGAAPPPMLGCTEPTASCPALCRASRFGTALCIARSG